MNQDNKKDIVLSKEMERRLPYTLLVSNRSIIENFESTSSPTNPNFYYDNSKIDTNIVSIQEIQSKYTKIQSNLLDNHKDISKSIGNYESNVDVLKNNNNKYHYDDKQDPNVILHPEESKDINYAILRDVNEIKLYQNSVYITTSIAIATLLIGTIILTKK